ncbi:MAG TPA: CBS domain-containing protein [Solirubrobacteraceae bacterium]|jgi:CBS domain-containing protein
MATVGDITERDVPAVGPEDDVETVLRVMRENELQGVPVVNEGGRVMGIITESDLVLSEEGSDLHLPHFVELFGGVVFLEPLAKFEDRLRKAFASKARDLMTEDPVTISADATAREAGRIISRAKHDRLPVIDGDGRLLGVVTRLDVLDALSHEE